MAEPVIPLNAIRMFAVVGRVLSLSKAAEELSVTTSAVSHQIKALETYLGIRLLHRQGNRVTLTSEGRAYLTSVSDGLTQVSRATRALKTSGKSKVLKISAPLSFSVQWLMPRIDQFTKLYPDVAISISAIWMPVDTGQREFDLRIRYTENAPSGYRCDKLGSNELFPVCSPALLKGSHPLKRPADLRHHTLIESADDIYFDPTNPGWAGWLAAANVADATSQRYMNFSPRCLMHQAVERGQGLGLSRTLLAADGVASGRLVVPFGPIVPLSSSYYIVCDEENAGRREIVAFRAWAIEQAEASRRALNLQ